MWCYAAADVHPIVPAPPLEDGIERLRLMHQEVVTTLTDLRCNHALNFAVLMLAALKGRFAIR